MKRAVSLLLSLCFLLSTCGCGDSKTAQSESLSDSSGGATETVNLSAKEVLDGILTLEERQNYFDTIYDIEFGSPIGNYCYHQAPEAHSKIFSIGLKGVPMLIYETAYHNGDTKEIHTNSEGSICHLHFYNALASMIRANEYTFYDISPKTENYLRECLYLFFKDAKSECPQIMGSSIDADKKIAKLRIYGMLAIPYIKEEADKKDSFLTSYLREIGIHLSTEEYAEIACVYQPGASIGYEKVYNHPKAESFDYKVWLDENEEDLNNLFKFLDAYCAEYEAENAEE